jgi:putative tryptophan/tyrosine transport system substrate-binding protein
MMRRREFIAGLGSAAAWPLAARAQQPAVPVIGYLAGGALGLGENAKAFRNALAEAGYVEGRNLSTIDYGINGQFERLPELAADLVSRQVALIFVSGLGAARAAKARTRSIPIVFVFGEDPVKEGFVTSLNRPGGNITGISYFTNQLFGKRLGLLKEVVPRATAVALLVNPANPNAEPDTKETQIAAAALGLVLHVAPVARERDLEAVFATFDTRKIGGVVVDADSLLLDNREQLAALAARHAIPAIYDRREFLTAGGLMSYGANPAEAYRQAGFYAGRILKGEKPTDLPVQQATTINLIINLKTAKALGLTIPETLLATADEVIQ